MFQPRRMVAVAVAVTLWLGCTLSVRGEWRQLGDLTSHELDGATVTLTCGDARVRVTALTEHVVRVRLAPSGDFARDFSWAVEPREPAASFTAAAANDDTLAFDTGALRVSVLRRPCRISVLDPDGNVLTADDPARGMSWEVVDSTEISPVRAFQRLPDDVKIFGLGEKAGGLHREKRTWVMWNSDTPGYDATTDPIYASVPFFIAARGERYHGVFFDNPWRSSFDFGRAERNVLSFGAEGGELNYYVIAGPHPKDVIRRYTDLTGHMPLPPRWAIGYQQCRYSYFPEQRVMEVARTFREKKIPCDVLYFDIDYMDGYRCFTWNKDRFPNPKRMTRTLGEMGFHTIAIIDPGIKNEDGYAAYDTGFAIDAWVKRPDGSPYVGRVWPGDCVFPDFTADRVRDWWADLYPPFIDSSGLSGVWNDMNEPANFVGPNGTVPLDLRHDNAGQPASHRAVHNVYGMQMARATRAGLQRARPTERPFTVTRATYAGGQRAAAIWTGDNISNWDHLAMSIPMCLSSGISGMPFVGPDIGGFIGGATPELYARWIQFGALLPFSRTHTSCNNPDQEPWSFGPRVEAIARAALERRYAWMPYIYTLFEEASRTGTPVVRPIWLEQPGYDGWSLDSTFFLGPNIFVAPKLTPGEEPYSVNLPAGVWFEGNTGEVYGGDRWYQMPGDLETLVHFYRAGAIIPTQSPVQHTMEKPTEPLILDVWPWGKSTGTLYEDDGMSYTFQQGDFRRSTFSCSADDQQITVTIDGTQGAYQPDGKPPLVRVHRLSEPPATVHLARSDISDMPSALEDEAQPSTEPGVPANGTYRYDRASRSLLVRLHSGLGAMQRLRIEFAQEARPAASPVILSFDGDANALNRPRGASAVSYPAGVAQFTVRWSWTARTVLPRLRVSADALPFMELELATQTTENLIVRFSTEEAPETVTETEAIKLVPGRGMQTYRVKMADIAGEMWKGVVYWMELEFADGIRGGETIQVAHVAFLPDDGS